MSGLAEELARTGRSTDAFEFAKQLDDFVYNSGNGWILHGARLGPLEAIEPGGLVLVYDVDRLPAGGWSPLPSQGGIAPPCFTSAGTAACSSAGSSTLRRAPPAPAVPAARVASAPPAVPTPRPPAAPPVPEPVGPDVRSLALPLVSGSAVAAMHHGVAAVVACTTSVEGDEQVVAVVNCGPPGFGDELGRSLFALGSGGSTVTTLSGVDDQPTIVVGGVVTPRSGARPHGAVARLTATGLLDPGFGDRGIVALDADRGQVVDLHARPTGETLVLTRLDLGPGRCGAALVLLDGAGAPVPGFGQADGVVALVPPPGCALDLGVLAHDPATGHTYAAGSLTEPGSPQRPTVVAFNGGASCRSSPRAGC